MELHSPLAVGGARLVVTGGSGQLGRALGACLEARAAEAVLLDRDALDLTDRGRVRAVLTGLRPDVIIHGAAYTRVDAAESDPEGAWAVNAEGTRAVAEAAEEAKALLVYVSTDYVFSGERAEPYPEGHPTGPVSCYGATKLAGERAVAALDRHLIVRTSWVFGEGPNFVRAVLRAAAAGSGEDLPVVDDQRGRPTHAGDLAAGILALVEREAEGTYHLQGGGDPGTWADVAEAALAAAGMPVKVRRITTAEYDAGRARRGDGPTARRPANGVLDCSKAAALGVALRPWREAIDAYVRVME